MKRGFNREKAMSSILLTKRFTLATLLFTSCVLEPVTGAHSTAFTANHNKASAGIASSSHRSALSSLAARLAAHTHRSKAKGRSRTNPDTAEVVTALQGVAKSLEDEQAAAKKVASSRDAACRQELGEFSPANKAIRDGERLIAVATDTQTTISYDISGLEASITGIKGQISESTAQIDKLTQELKTLRDRHKAAADTSVASLQELDAVISQGAWQEEQQQRQHEHHSNTPSKLSNEVIYLQRLGRQLGAAARTRRSAAPAFLQIQQGKRGVISNVQTLQADRRELLRARTLDSKNFNEEEKKLMDLIKGRRDRLKQYEADLQSQQLVLTDKLRQAAETNRTRAMAARVVQRDREVLSGTERVCELEGDVGKALIALRSTAISLVKMPSKLLYSMDAAMFLSKDLKELQAAPAVDLNLVQVRRAHRVASRAFDETASDSQGRVEMHTAQQQSSTSLTGEHSTGPFDGVERMLRTLMANLNDQGNSDTTLNQWCLESKEENEKSRQAIKTAFDQAGAQVLWSTAAISTLEDQIAFFGAEISRLEGRAKEIKQYANMEAQLLGEQLADHRSAKEILDEIVDVLKGDCDIDEAELVLAQTSHTHHHQRQASLNHGQKTSLRTKHGQCTEAVKLIMQSSAKLVELDGAITGYLKDHARVTGMEVASAEGAAQQRTTDKTSAEAARAGRVRDLETAKGERRRKEEELVLVEKAAKAIDQKCIVRESHGERMARRQDEIDALKQAYDVLNGETIPVQSSLVSVAA